MESDIQEFWQKNPCGASLVGDLTGDERREYEDFFERYDAYRYAKESHILTNLDRIDFRGKRVLEIGLGQGADAEAIVARGGIYSGVDLTEESVKRVKMRFELKGLNYNEIKQGSALDLPSETGSFDIVFSHGVLHHIPEIKKASAEIARVLAPGGELISMLYAHRSLNYLLSIALLRRVGLLGLYLGGIKKDGVLGDHLANARRMGIWRYLSMRNFIHKNTDGPGNPYSKVYDLKRVREDFPEFDVAKSYQCFMHAPPLKVAWLPFARSLGWHLWAHMRKRAK